MYSFPDLEPMCCSMSSSSCYFLKQVSQEAGQVIWYSHLFQNFPQFVVIHTVKGFCLVNKANVDVFLELSCFFDDPMDVGNLISGSFALSKSIFHLPVFSPMYLPPHSLHFWKNNNDNKTKPNLLFLCLVTSPCIYVSLLRCYTYLKF